MKNNKKGFTLTEILVVIAIIGIILLIAIPSIIAINKSIKKRELETKKAALISAAELYAKNNISEFGAATIIRIPVRTLIYYGYVTLDGECPIGSNEPIGCVIDPTDSSSMNEEIITIKRNLSITQATFGEETGNYIIASFYSNGSDNFANGESFLQIGCEAYKSCEIIAPLISRSQGFSIIGWNVDATAHEKLYSEKEKIFVSKDTDFYAITRKDITVTFDPNGGQLTGENIRSCSYYNTEESCPIDFPEVEREGYGHEGWFDKESNQKLASNLISNSVELLARWNLGSYTINYTLNGGTATNPTSYTVATETFTLNNPIKTGYEFVGWTGTDLNESTQVVRITKGSTGDRRFAANYDANKYTVAYNKNAPSGKTVSGTTSNSTHTYDVSKDLTENGYKLGGYIFKGWNTKSDGTGANYEDKQSVKNLTSSKDATVTLYAKWDACPAGKYAVAGATSCSVCEGNTYTSTSGQSACTACASGQTSNSSHTGCSANVLTIMYNGNGNTGFSSTSTSHNFAVDSNGYVLDNGTIYTVKANYGSVFNSGSGLANYNNAGFINFTKTGHHGLSNEEWVIGNTTFGQDDNTVTATQLAEAGGCDLSVQDCTVTAKVNWKLNTLFIQYNGNGGTWNSSNTDYNVNEYGTVITTSNNSIYTQKVSYGESLPNTGFIDYNGAYLNWEKTGYSVSSGKEYYIKTDLNQSALSQASSYTATYLSNLGGCNLSEKECVIQLKVNWKAYSCLDGDNLNTTTNKCEYNASYSNGGGQPCYCSSTAVGTEAQTIVYCTRPHTCKQECNAAGFNYVIEGSAKCGLYCSREGTLNSTTNKCEYDPSIES